MCSLTRCYEIKYTIFFLNQRNSFSFSIVTSISNYKLSCKDTIQKFAIKMFLLFHEINKKNLLLTFSTSCCWIKLNRIFVFTFAVPRDGVTEDVVQLRAAGEVTGWSEVHATFWNITISLFLTTVKKIDLK